MYPGGSGNRRQQDHARQFDDDGDRQRRCTSGLRRGHHLADVMHRGARPGPELLGIEVQGVHEQWQYTNGKSSAERYERHGEHCVLMLDAAHSCHRANRGGAADGKAGGDEDGSFAGETKQTRQPIGSREADQDNTGDQEQGQPPQAEDVPDADLESQQHDPGTHEVLSGEVQARPGAPRGQDSRARYIG